MLSAGAGFCRSIAGLWLGNSPCALGFFAEACPDDARLRREVEALLEIPSAEVASLSTLWARTLMARCCSVGPRC